MKDILEEIASGHELRKNLTELKKKLKEKGGVPSMLFLLAGNYDVLYHLLQEDDAKVRKNTALVMGILRVQEFLDVLYEAYERETQLFVKSSYLSAIKGLDYRKYLMQLKDRLHKLSEEDTKESEQKHRAEEIRELSDLILNMEGAKKHSFTGYDKKSNLVLLTNRNFKNITMEQLSSKQTKEFNAGLLVQTNDMKNLQTIRTYQELLFRLEDLPSCLPDPVEAAKQIGNSSLMDFLQKRHDGTPPYYFRIELKSKLDLAKKSAFTKKLASEIESDTERKLINTTSNYEIELRLIQNKTGSYNFLIKLYTLKDERFSYRRQSIAASIQPVNAALVMHLAGTYLKQGAQVLDPFCGVGTMLIERSMYGKTGSMYGLDIFGEAIDKGRENSEAAKIIINYINRDFFDFKHEYLFDEIISNMPMLRSEKEERGLFLFYKKFFQKAEDHLVPNGVIVLYSHNKDFVKRCAVGGYQLLAEYEVSKVEGCYVFVIQMKK